MRTRGLGLVIERVALHQLDPRLSKTKNLKICKARASVVKTYLYIHNVTFFGGRGVVVGKKYDRLMVGIPVLTSD